MQAACISPAEALSSYINLVHFNSRKPRNMNVYIRLHQQPEAQVIVHQTLDGASMWAFMPLAKACAMLITCRAADLCDNMRGKYSGLVLLPVVERFV